MSEVLKVVFVAFTQHCIQSNATHVRGVKGVKYFAEQKIKGYVGGVKGVLCTQWPLTPLRGKATVFEKPSILWVYLFTTSQSEEAALLTFWYLSNYKGDYRQDTQPTPNS